jgi:hypothetical protein
MKAPSNKLFFGLVALNPLLRPCVKERLRHATTMVVAVTLGHHVGPLQVMQHSVLVQVDHDALNL